MYSFCTAYQCKTACTGIFKENLFGMCPWVYLLLQASVLCSVCLLEPRRCVHKQKQIQFHAFFFFFFIYWLLSVFSNVDLLFLFLYRVSGLSFLEAYYVFIFELEAHVFLYLVIWHEHNIVNYHFELCWVYCVRLSMHKKVRLSTAVVSNLGSGPTPITGDLQHLLDNSYKSLFLLCSRPHCV